MPSKSPVILDPVDRFVGSMIRLHRMRRGHTQASLAEAIKVTPETMGRYERGTVPLTPRRLASVAAVLGLNPGVFLTGAPTEYGKVIPVELGSMANSDTRRLLRAFDQITGRARKRMLNFVVTLARASREQDELVRYRRAAGIRVHPEDDPE